MLISNPYECVQQCKVLYQNTLQKSLHEYLIDIPPEKHIQLLFGQQSQEDVYFLYFIALVLLRATMSQPNGIANLRLFLTGNVNSGS